MENNTLCNRHSLGVNNHTKMYVTYTRIYGWSDYGGESSYQPGYRLENMMWMTLLVYDYIIPGEKMIIFVGNELNGYWLNEVVSSIEEEVMMIPENPHITQQINGILSVSNCTYIVFDISQYSV